MDKRIVCAVAGSGKTTSIIDSIDPHARCYIITYTNENLYSLEDGLIKKFGRVPENVFLQTYFSFLYTFCFRPFFSYDLQDRSYTWNKPDKSNRRFKKSDLGHYMTPRRYLYANRLSKMITELGGLPKVKKRLEKHVDILFVDEVQDFAANDFNFLMDITAFDIDVLLVGDFFQHTFDTSRDGNTRTNLHKRGLDKYLAEFGERGFDVDTTSLNKSYRCSPDVCRFIRENIGVPIHSHRSDSTIVEVVDSLERVGEIYRDDECIKLFYDKNDRYVCRANNWGKCKGLNNYLDVCVVLNGTSSKHFYAGTIDQMAESTRNKLYVACSRARRNLYIVDSVQFGYPPKVR